MRNIKVKQGSFPHSLPLSILLSFSLIGISSIIVVAGVNQMNVPTFIASLSTKKVTVSELKQGKLNSVVLIDVRTPEEYAEDHIGNSLLVPLTDIQTGLGVHQIQVIAQKYTKLHHTQPTIILYCTKGPRSIKAYKELEKTGLKLMVLEGGITAWRQIVQPSKDPEILAPISNPTNPKSTTFSAIT